MIASTDPVLLIGKKNFFVRKEQKKFNCQYGQLDLTKIRKYGQVIKTNTGHEFLCIKPTITDLLRHCRRMPQIVTPKDAASILSVTGLDSNWHCLDAGAGSGFLTLFLGSFLDNGRIVTYEKRKDYSENVKKNVRQCGLDKRIIVKNKDAKKFTEKNLDLITLDMIDAEKMVKKAWKALKPGGWLVVYSPHIEQQKKVMDQINKQRFAHVQTMENIRRYWQVSDFTHPKPSGIMHTGFLTFARKLI